MEQHEVKPTIALTKMEAAHELRVCVRTIDHLLSTRQLAFRRIGRRVVIPRSSLLAFLRGAQ